MTRSNAHNLKCVCFGLHLYRLCLYSGISLASEICGSGFTSFRQRLTSQEVGSASETRCSSRVWDRRLWWRRGEPLSLLPRKEGSVVIVAFLKFRKHSTQGTHFLLVCSENWFSYLSILSREESEHHQACPVKSQLSQMLVLLPDSHPPLLSLCCGFPSSFSDTRGRVFLASDVHRIGLETCSS